VEGPRFWHPLKAISEVYGSSERKSTQNLDVIGS